ncbi:MAG TPA: ring-cleaving dioxygenase [Bacillus sp. (in: firmicutes)]|uniref:ring-cleaving dioxygenase n=1 Tax=Bacillus litorisediminis TaxID=2922713 RepID=UPI001FAD3B33|nr:ring-cleaving dioxygenase [Bacillus litorisediminis]HWO75317.1 ring-cleaving dioxygenase [Bacillus sp. (in: firmicutes)]
MIKRTEGIHHITAIVGNPQENVDFYAGVLGLRLVKRTINFDDPGTYHFYFGDEVGNPGTIMTFFPWPNAYKGRIGSGQVGVTSFVVPTGSFPFWEERLKKFNVEVTKSSRFGEDYLNFEDPHGLQLELVEREPGKKSEWSFGEVTSEVAIKGFGGATLLSARPAYTAKLLEETMGLEKIGEDGEYVRFQATADIGNIIDMKLSPVPKGMMGAGTVHHIAYRAKNDEDQLDWKSHVESAGFGVTPVQPRQYFNAIYFREYGDILFEIATDPPGFTLDEPQDSLGEKLMLPDWYEPQRDKIEKVLLPFKVRELD